MADNQNTGANNPNVSNNAAGYRDIGNALKKLIEEEGDYNNLLKDRLKDVKQLEGAYKKIEARIKTLNNETINTRELNREISRIAVKKQISEQAVRDIEKEISKETRDKLEQEKNIAEQLNGQLTNSQKRSLLEKQKAVQSSLAANLELKSLEYAKLSVKAAEEEESKAIAALANEKQVAKQLGISGNLAKAFAEKLGVGEEVYGAMTKEARKLVDMNGKALGFWSKLSVLKVGAKAMAKSLWENISDPAIVAAGIIGVTKAMGKGLSAAGGAIKGGMGMITGTGGPISGITSGISSMLTAIPLVGGLLAGVVDIFSNLLDFAVNATSKIQEMGRQVGLTKDQSILLNNQFSNFATMSGKAYLNSENLFKTYLDISKVLGTNNQISENNLQTQYELNKFLGVDAETSAEIERSSLITGKSSKDIAQNIYSQTKNLERATGISFNFQKILKEASSLGGVLGLAFAKYPEKITKAVLSTKALGLELKQLDGMADSFLDFESSISKEFEAQLLTGKDINLAKAREAFLNNDLVTAAQEITKQVGDSREFLSMNRIQQESIAAAMGMSRDQMADMLKQQEYLSKFNAKDVKDLHEKVRLLRLQGKEQEAINLLGDEEAYNKMVTATASEDLAGFIDKIKQSFADLISNTGLADFVQNTIKWLSEPGNIMKIVNKIKDVFATVVDVVGAVVGGIMRFLNYFPGINIDQSMIETVESAGSQIRSANLGSLSVGGAAASDKAGIGGSKGGGGQSSRGSSSSGGLGTSTQSVIIKMREKEVFEVIYSGYNENPSTDQQLTSKYSSNPIQN
jgi:hypothetical protein